MDEFRFQNLDNWRRSSDLALQLFAVCDQLEGDRRYRFAEQLRAAFLSELEQISKMINAFRKSLNKLPAPRSLLYA